MRGALPKGEEVPMVAQTNPKEAAEVLQRDPQAVYLDVRTVEEYEAGHPAGAWNVPVVFLDAARTPNPDFERVVQAVLPKDRKIFVGCQSGVRSMRAAEILERLGYRDVTNVAGGFGGARDPSGQVTVPGWRDSGLPVETGNPPERSYAALRAKA
jgi:rhodanese-related sulfurtransferase